MSIFFSSVIVNNKFPFSLLLPLKHWLDTIEIDNSRLAHLVCKIIPCTCPFARTIRFFGHTLFEIPPLCKLNPLYEEVMSLRFRALNYLADSCGEDINKYIC